jgi:pimeloyl-ACP methyl ester carboxylesterase
LVKGRWISRISAEWPRIWICKWEDPVFVGGRERLASFARVVIFDRRGTGLSDPLDRPGTLEQQMDDLDAVLEAVGMEHVALFGGVEAGLATHRCRSRQSRIY